MVNPYVSDAKHAAAVEDYRREFFRWARRMREDAQHARQAKSKPWWKWPFRTPVTGWAWQVTKEQQKRFAESGDPMRDYPEEMKAWPRALGLTADETDREFWKLHAEYVRSH